MSSEPSDTRLGDAPDRLHFVTGRLAEFSLRRVLSELGPQLGIEYSVQVLPITVAALMTPEWIAQRIEVPVGTSRVMIPGYCQGNLAPIESAAGVPVERGPRDLRQLPSHFGQRDSRLEEYGGWDIEILAEINYAPRLPRAEILTEAKRLKAAGADLIDVGCDPGEPWSGVGDCVRALKDEGHRVSIDSLNPLEIAAATAAGAELVLSVNATNRHAAADWGAEVVVIPDELATLGGLEETIEMLATAGVPLRVDPVLEPIGFGLAASLGRYLEVRRRYADVEMMMGIGNLTELTDADSAAINVLLLGICQELGIHSVLTTQVINWARTSVAECDRARRVVHYAVNQRALPKHLEPSLVMLRDTELVEMSEEEIDQLARQIRDNNFRLFAQGDQVHLVSAGLHLAQRDPFLLFEELLASGAGRIDASHAFYLGFEMAKAATALTLGKQYRQDEALDWGLLTVPEESHRLRRGRASGGEDNDGSR